MSDATVEFVMPAGSSRERIRMGAGSDRRDQTVHDVSAAGWDHYERPLPERLFHSARENPGVIVDVGANTGLYSLIACGASMRNEVLAFEPDPSVIPILESNIALNYGVRIDVRKTALSSKPGRASLYVPLKDHGLVETSSSLEADFKSEHSSIETVDVSTLDAVLREALSPDKRVTVLKIDVEGHEFEVLAGGGWTVHRFRPLIFVEVLHRANVAGLTRYIREHDYLDVPLIPDATLCAHGEVAHDTRAWNHALVPHERLLSFLSVGPA